MTQGRQTREFNFVEDLADGFVRAGTAPGVEGEIFNLGCGEEVAIRDLALMILDLMGNPIEAELGALPERPTEIMRMYSDSTKARELLGWKPEVELRDGLARTIQWYRDEAAKPASSFLL
jgi:UDP-glucose 4-epimerase